MRPIVAQDRPTPRLTDVSLLAVFERVLPHALIVEVLAPFLPATRRSRKLPAEITLQLIIAMNLYAHDALTLVISKLFLAAQLSWTGEFVVPGKSAISEARQRLGVAPVVALFHRCCVPLATPETPGAFLGDLRLMAIDATTEITADTPANTRAFGKHRSQYGPSAFPLVLAVYLLECGTHAVVDAIVRPGHDNPVTLARRLTRTLTEDMLVLLDRGLTVWSVLTAIHDHGAQFLGRVDRDRLLVPLAGNADGSYLARLYDPSVRRTQHTPFLLVRVLVYTLDLPGWPHDGETARLITTLLDPVRYPARTLIAAYHERWEIELTIDEIESHQRPVGRPLRSKTPTGVIQELYGLLIAHYLIRAEMVEAAATVDVDPDRVSFVHAVGLVITMLPLAQVLPTPERQRLHACTATILLRYQLPPRERRSNPRVIRRKTSKFPRKTPQHQGVSLRTSFLDAICPSALGAALVPQASVSLVQDLAA
jgi:hypothetical protein